MFGRGLLNLALGAELKSLPALKEGERLFVCPLANLEMAVLDALSQLRSEKSPVPWPHTNGGREESSTL
ncbi:hypothetical protein TNCV_3966461 [Trichonephila clavipes]|nr:hypothetical protein TNCV_3966461 [Trichonephila clavipes]